MLVGNRIAFLEDGTFSFIGSWEEAEARAPAQLRHFLAGEPDEGER